MLVLAGPTAVGKSSTAMELARRLDGEIISADSVQVYRGLDIGSNKASTSDRAAVPHHLIDVADVFTPYSAGKFFEDARDAIESVAERGKVPIVVGGTMMYVRWLVYGPPATPPPSEETVARVDAMVASAKGDWGVALKLLEARDPQRASALLPNDWYRLKRALQVSDTTGGVGVSQIPLRGGAPRPKTGNRRQRGDLDHDFRCFFLYDDRIAMNRRIDERCESMLLPHNRCREIGTSDSADTSVLSEVGDLLKRGAFSEVLGSPARAIGYRQTIRYLLSRAAVARQTPGADAMSAETSETNANEDAEGAFREFVDEFQQATRGYARQQMSWFRKEPDFLWIPSGEHAVSDIEAYFSPDEHEFAVQLETSSEDQQRRRAHVMEQGKLMKTYIAARNTLADGSDALSRTVALSERIARDIANTVDESSIEGLAQALSSEPFVP